MYYEIDSSFQISGAPYSGQITNTGEDLAISSSAHTKIDVKLKIYGWPNFIDKSSPFYYNGKKYSGSDVLFDVYINNIGTTKVHLYFNGSDMVYDGTNWFVYTTTSKAKFDGMKRKLYYSPENYMKLQTSEGDVVLNNSATQLYT